MSHYSTLATSIVQQQRAQEKALSLINETSCSQFFLHSECRDKVFLFFHGFTATPAQFLPLGRVLFASGYNVVVPLMPGHGLAGDWNPDSPPPLPEDQQTYRQFAQTWLSRVQALGREVWVGGLSGGGTMAAWLALDYPDQITRTLLFAPYLSNANFLVDWAIKILDIYFEWKSEPGTANFGYPGFRMPALRLFLDMGQEVLSRVSQQPSAPTLLVLSESDRSVREKDQQILFDGILKYHPQSWYHCFDKALDIPHTMMTKGEGNECISLLISVVKAYVESTLTWTEVEGIRDRMAQGQSFAAAAAALGLTERVLPDLAPVITMNKGLRD